MRLSLHLQKPFEQFPTYQVFGLQHRSRPKVVMYRCIGRLFTSQVWENNRISDAVLIYKQFRN